MTLSDEQRREVNRTNSQKSTGPRTGAGKSRSKLNGLKHGLRAATLVLPGEDPEALERRFDAWTEELDPRTDLERYFVRSAVEAAWRLDRVRRAEAAAVARRVTAAGDKADRRDAFEVEHNLKYLGLWPERNLRTLRGSARGCRALLERWRDLVAALEHAGSWLDSERQWAFALAGLKPHRWHEDAAVLRLVTLDLATQVDGCTPDETRLFVVAHLKHDEADMNITPFEFEVRVEAILAGLPEAAAARAELLVWARASIVELEAHLEEVELSERRDRELAVEEAMFDSRKSGAARLRAELAQYRVLRTSLQEVRRLQCERGDAEDLGVTDLTAGSADPSAPTEANFEAEILSMTAEATTPTEANAEAVGLVTRVDIVAPTGPSPEAPIPSETVDAVAPSVADAEQEVLFVSAEAAAPIGPNAGLEIARGVRHVFETPVLGPTLWGLKGGDEALAIRPDPVAPSEPPFCFAAPRSRKGRLSEQPNSGSQILFAMAGWNAHVFVDMFRWTKGLRTCPRLRGQATRPPDTISRETAPFSLLAACQGARTAGVMGRANAEADSQDLAPSIVEMRVSGLSLRAIAARLNAEGHTTWRCNTGSRNFVHPVC